LREQTARADSARAVLLDQIIALQRRILDSLAIQLNRLVGFRGDLRSDLTDVQRQLVQIQELTGQSQQRLSELRGQIESRTQAVAAGAARSDSSGGSGGPTGPGADQLFELGLQQLRRNSPATARVAFQKLLHDYPAHERAGDAQFFIGESWDKTNPDSAVAAYEMLMKNFSGSPRVATALYRLGLAAEQRRDRSAARQYYSKLVATFPRSDEAPLAREKLQALGR